MTMIMAGRGGARERWAEERGESTVRQGERERASDLSLVNFQSFHSNHYKVGLYSTRH